jgi:hypothetical protein
MKKQKFVRPVALLLITVLLLNISFAVSASASIGSSIEANNVSAMTPGNQEQAKGLAKAFARGAAAGAVVGLVVGFYSRLGYEYVTSLFGEQAIASSFSTLNYDPNNLEKFDNPKN